MAKWESQRSRKFWTDVAERLKSTRHLLGISEDEAAAAMLVTLKTYRKWERAERHRENVMGVLAL